MLYLKINWSLGIAPLTRFDTFVRVDNFKLISSFTRFSQPEAAHQFFYLYHIKSGFLKQSVTAQTTHNKPEKPGTSKKNLEQ